jgi:isoamylase
LMGDEVARTQSGNNNAYCHDNEISWFNWGLRDYNQDLLRFFEYCIAFRKMHPALRNRWHLNNRDMVGSGYADITWHGQKAWEADFSTESRSLAFMLDGKNARGGSVHDDSIYLGMNMHWESHWFELPSLPDGLQWHVFANTGAPEGQEIWQPGDEPLLEFQGGLEVAERSVVILVGK